MSTLDIDQARVGRRHHRRARRPYAARFLRTPSRPRRGLCLYSLFLRVGTQLGFFVSWIAAIGLTELLFFVSWTATPIFRELAEEKSSAYVLIYPLP